jgi:hypothetical protein
VIEQESFIGVVHERSFRRDIPSAVLMPLFRLCADGISWHPLSEAERKRVFPNNGHVSWIFVPVQLSEGSVWRFKVTIQPSYDERPDDPRRDRYMVARRTDRQLIEVVDVERLGGEPMGRERLCTGGIRLHVSGPATLLIRAEEKLWCSLPFVPKEGEPGLHVIDPSVLEQPLRFRSYSDPNSTFELPIRGELRNFLLPDVKIEGTAVLRDWSPDPLALKRVMGKLRKWDRGFADTLELSEKALERVEAILAAPPVSINDLDMERARFQRARAYLASLRDADALNSAARTAIEEGPLAIKIEKEKERILQAETARARDQANEAFRAEREELDRVREQIAGLERERDKLTIELEAIRQRQASFIDRLDEELESRLARLLEKPEQVLADVAILKAVEKALGSTTSSKRTEPSRESPPSVDAVEHEPPIPGCTDLVAFSKRFQGALLANDTPPNVWRSIFSSLLGGGVPLIMGARARRSFEAFARVATRGEVHWVQVEPTWTCLRDVMLGGLSELLSKLAESGKLQFVVLEGVNRAPVESYLCPLLSDYADAWDGRVPGLAPLANGDLNGHPARLTVRPWPKNVLLGGTLVEGITSLGLPTSCLGGCTLLLTDEIRAGAELDVLSKMHPSLRGRNGAATNTSEVSLDAWSSWRERATSVNLDAPIEKWGRLASDHGLSRLGRDRFLATYAASRLVASGDESAVSDSIAHAALPLLAATAGEQRFDFSGSSFEYRDLDRVAELISRLIRN